MTELINDIETQEEDILPETTPETLEDITEEIVSEDITNQKPENLPEKFWDAETQTVRMDALINSYKALEQKMSSRPPAPVSPEDYDIDVSHGLFEVDHDINCKLCENNFTKEQAQFVYDLAAEKFVPLVFEIAEEFKADREVERLMSTFGGSDKWKEVSRQLLAFGAKNLPPEILKNLSSSFEGVMILHKMMKSQTSDSGFSDNTDIDAGPQSEDDIQSLMRDPRYWRDRDPAIVAKVSEGFKKLYG